MQVSLLWWRSQTGKKLAYAPQAASRDEIAFQAWCDNLDAYAASLKRCGYAVTELTGRPCWHLYYDDGLTPEEAFRADELALL